MALPATDAFTGTNNTALQTYSGNWGINAGAFDIQTNAVSPNSSNNECGARWTADAFNADQYAQVTVAALSGIAGAVGPATRCDTGGNDSYYGYYTDGNNRYLFKMVNGTWTQLGSTGTSSGVGTVTRLESSGSTHTPKQGGVGDTTIGAQTDSALASGAAGICGYSDSTAVRLDDWEGGNLGGGGGGSSVPVFMFDYRRRRI